VTTEKTNLLKITDFVREQIIVWIEALRSGEYKQARGSLEKNDGFCCLGVGCKLFIEESKIEKNRYGFIEGATPDFQLAAPKWLQRINNDFRTRVGANISLADLNDSSSSTHGYCPVHCPSHSFDEIADMLQLVYLEGAL
jgi:hypothetical protein